MLGYGGQLQGYPRVPAVKESRCMLMQVSMKESVHFYSHGYHHKIIMVIIVPAAVSRNSEEEIVTNQSQVSSLQAP